MPLKIPVQWRWLLALLVLLTGPVYGMWVAMSNTELLEKSEWIVVGEWAGQAPAKGKHTADIGVISISEVLKGRRDASVAFVGVRGANQPISSSDLRFQRGDRGIWFLRKSPGGDMLDVYLVDHPQRFLKDTPENAAAIRTLRQQLQRR